MAGSLASSAPPAWTPPTGPIPDRSKELVTVSAAFMIPIVAAVGLQFWVRVKMVGKTGLDDWFIGVATVLSLIWCAFVILATQHGTGKHLVDIPPSEIPLARKYSFFLQPLSILTQWMVKVSIGLFLLRIAATKTYRHICLGFVVLTSLCSFAAFCFMMLHCKRISLNWDRDRATVGRGCPPMKVGRTVLFSYSIFCALSDFFLVLLPFRFPGAIDNYMICGIMGAGTFAAAAAIVNIVYLENVWSSGDVLWNSVDVTIWAVVEHNVGIITASLPALKPLIAKAIEKSISSMTGEGFSGTGASKAHRLSPLRKKGGTQHSNQGGIMADIRANGNRGAANMDNESEEGIIGISRTTDVRVDLDTVSRSSGGILPAGAEDSGRRWAGGETFSWGSSKGGDLQEIPFSLL